MIDLETELQALTPEDAIAFMPSGSSSGDCAIAFRAGGRVPAAAIRSPVAGASPIGPTGQGCRAARARRARSRGRGSAIGIEPEAPPPGRDDAG